MRKGRLGIPGLCLHDKSTKNLHIFIMFTDSIGQEFEHCIIGIACLCSTMSGTSAGKF